MIYLIYYAKNIIVIIPKVKADNKAYSINNKFQFYIKQSSPRAIHSHWNLKDNHCNHNGNYCINKRFKPFG